MKLTARFILWLAKRMDVEGYFLQKRGGWRYRLGARLERWAFSRPVCWAWRAVHGKPAP